MLKRNLFGVPIYRWIFLGAIGIGLLGASVLIRAQLDIEWNVESLRSFVQSLGVWGPLAFTGILVFRFIFLIPTGLLLLASGIMFGPVYGTLYAGLGMFGSGLLKYIAATIVGRDVIIKRLPVRVQDWMSSMAQQKVSTFALAGVCAYPFFPKHVFQFVAILSGMSLATYVLSVLTGSFIRAAIFANVGEAIYSGAGLVLATTILVVGLALPMAVPAWRRWLLAPLSTSPTKPAETSL